jgi:ATP synthase I chain
MTSQSILRIERANYVIGGIAVIVAALTVPQRAALGVAMGVALTCLNFAALRWLVFKWTAAVKAGDERGGTRIYLILPKMVGMMAAVALIVLFLPINAVAFLIGYSIFLPSIVIGAVIDTVSPAPDPDDGAAGSTTPPTSPTSETHG